MASQVMVQHLQPFGEKEEYGGLGGGVGSINGAVPANAPNVTPHTAPEHEQHEPQQQPQQQQQQQQQSRQSINQNITKRVHREVRFGAYILGSTLGEGEFGKVKLGWRKDGKHPSQVAIKLIKRDSILKDSESEIKIHREINSLKLLNHPNIVNLVEVMKSGKYIGIVLEYASGGELFDYILHHKYLKENVAKKLFAQLISGVDYMHSKGLIHRDLKLENLLLDKHKNIIISDFGFVNSYNRDKNDLMKTSCGSPCYAAPELVLTQTPYEGRKVDIWSLGVILYAMLAGYLPFDDDPENEDGSDIVRLYHYICRTPLTFPEYVSPLARDLLRKIIVPDPKKRININEIRHHPWLAPHAQFLTMRQPEWDKIHKEKDTVATAQQHHMQTHQQQQNKRFSMVNERTNSSSLMMHDSKPGATTFNNQHSRSYSSTSISQLYSSPSISSSLANAVSRREIPKVPVPTGESSGSNSPSPTKYARGHAKAASASYTSASTALKAMVDDTASKRNSISSLDGITPTKTTYNFPTAPIPRSTTYTGTPIATIVESPARKPVMSAVPTLAPLSRPAYGSATSRDSNRLPHANKKPRPTSYHPSSMTSSLMASSGSSLDYMKIPSPVNVPISQFLSTSPSKSSPISETTERNVERNERIERLERIENERNGFEIGSTSPSVDNLEAIERKSLHPPVSSRRNSVVTHVHVNGVLSNDSAQSSPEHPARGNSVLSYLEDKMDGLDLNESPSKTKSTSVSPSSSVVTATAKGASVTPQINQSPTFDAQSSNSQGREPVEEIPKLTESLRDSVSASLAGSSDDLADSVKLNKPVTGSGDVPQRSKSRKKAPTDTRRHSSIHSRKEVTSKENKENLNVATKADKKRNRFSLLSLYSSYSADTSSVTKKVLEPSQDTNVSSESVVRPQDASYPLKSSSASTSTAYSATAPPQERQSQHSSNFSLPQPPSTLVKEQKRVHSGASSNSKKSTTSTSTAASSANGKEASAARKVMDFFKRRSVRM